jgi:hypothetical protein
MARLTEPEGRSISRSEALRIARQILERAEQERLAIAEREAEDAADTGRNAMDRLTEERIDDKKLWAIEANARIAKARTRQDTWSELYANNVPVLVAALRAAYARIDELEAGAYLTMHHGGGKTRTALDTVESLYQEHLDNLTHGSCDLVEADPEGGE